MLNAGILIEFVHVRISSLASAVFLFHSPGTENVMDMSVEIPHNLPSLQYSQLLFKFYVKDVNAKDMEENATRLSSGDPSVLCKT